MSEPVLVFPSGLVLSDSDVSVDANAWERLPLVNYLRMPATFKESLMHYDYSYGKLTFLND